MQKSVVFMIVLLLALGIFLKVHASPTPYLDYVQQLTQDENIYTRMKVVDEIIKNDLHGNVVFTILAPLLNDPDENLRMLVAVVIHSRVPDKSLVAAQALVVAENFKVKSLGIYLLLKSTDPKALNLLNTLVTSQDSTTMTIVARLVKHTREKKYLPMMAQLLTHGNGSVKKDILGYLATVRSESLLPLIKNLTKDPAADVRAQTLRTLYTISPDYSKSFIILATKDSSPLVRETALKIISQYQDPSFLAVTEEMLEDTSPEVRRQAAFILLKKDFQQSSPLLSKLFTDQDLDIKILAAMHGLKFTGK